VHRNWPEVLDRFRASGRSVRDFCATEGIAPPLFYKWRRRLEGRDTGRVPPRKGGFVELKADVGGGSGLVIASLSGLRVEVSPEFDAGTLERVLACMTRAPACSG
jgi:transposase-like protein